MKIGDYINPFSTGQQEAREHFQKLSACSRAGIVVGTALAAIFTFPVLGLGGVAAFKALSDYSWSRRENNKEPVVEDFSIIEEQKDDEDDSEGEPSTKSQIVENPKGFDFQTIKIVKEFRFDVEEDDEDDGEGEPSSNQQTVFDPLRKRDLGTDHPAVTVVTQAKAEDKKVERPKVEEKKDESPCAKLIQELKACEDTALVPGIMKKYEPAKGEEGASLKNANGKGFFQLLVGRSEENEIRTELIKAVLEYISLSPGSGQYWGLNAVIEVSPLVGIHTLVDPKILNRLIGKVTNGDALSSLLLYPTALPDTKKAVLNRMKELQLALPELGDKYDDQFVVDLLVLIDLGDVSTKEGAAAAYKLIGGLLSNERIKKLGQARLRFKTGEEEIFNKNLAFLRVYPFYKQYVIDKKSKNEDLREMINSYTKLFEGNMVQMTGDIKKAWGENDFHRAMRNLK